MKKSFAILLIGLALPVCCLASLAGVKGPEVWLEFMGGNVRKDGLRCDLEAIKDAGFSGVHFFHIERKSSGVWPGCPEQIPCMSEKWDDVMQFLGEECARLGLALTVQNCPGWSQSGGPWIDLDHCQRDIECARADFSGGEAVKIPDVPEKFRDVDSDWRDVCVLAFPTPLGDEIGGQGVGACDRGINSRVPWRWNIGTLQSRGRYDFQHIPACIEDSGEVRTE